MICETHYVLRCTIIFDLSSNGDRNKKVTILTKCYFESQKQKPLRSGSPLWTGGIKSSCGPDGLWGQNN